MPDYEFLYKEARSLLQEEVEYHIERCNVADDSKKRCPCPGIRAALTFLEATKKEREEYPMDQNEVMAYDKGRTRGQKEILDELLIAMAGMRYPTPEKGGFPNVPSAVAHLMMGQYPKGKSECWPERALEQSLLRRLQAELPKLWTDELYSKEFQENKAIHRDFQHTLLHVFKAAGRLLEMVEDADHIGPEGSGNISSPWKTFPDTPVEKYVADIVISAVRLAIKSPSGVFDIETAITNRIESKMGVKL